MSREKIGSSRKLKRMFSIFAFTIATCVRHSADARIGLFFSIVRRWKHELEINGKRRQIRVHAVPESYLHRTGKGFSDWGQNVKNDAAHTLLLCLCL